MLVLSCFSIGKNTHREKMAMQKDVKVYGTFGEISEKTTNISQTDDVYTEETSDTRPLLHSNSTVNLRQLTLLNGIVMIVGCIIGSGIFVSPTAVYSNAGSTGMALIVWTLSGILAALGATCYAELGTMIQRSGGDYSYILEAFGPLAAFTALWTTVVMIQPAVQAIMALTVANYALQPVYGNCILTDWPVKLVAACAVCLLTAINCFSVEMSMKIMNLLTATKLIALSIIISLGLWQLIKGETQHLENAFQGQITAGGMALSFYAGLYSFSGWRSLNVVVGELQNPSKLMIPISFLRLFYCRKSLIFILDFCLCYRNLPRAVWIGLFIVTAVYVLTNVAYLVVIPPEEFASSDAVAVTFCGFIAEWLQWIIPIFVSLASLGSLNACIFTNSRMISTGGQQGQLPLLLGFLHNKYWTPVPALIFNCLLVLIMTYIRDVYILINYMSFALWLITGASTSGLLVLRRKYPEIPRPIRVPIIIPIFVVGCCIGLLLVPAVTKPLQTVIGIVIMLIAIPLYYTMMWTSHGERYQQFSISLHLIGIRLFNVGPSSQDDQNNSSK